VLGTPETPITLLTPPTIIVLDNLLVTALSGTSRIRDSLWFDVHDGCTSQEGLNLVGHPDLRVLQALQIAYFCAVESTLKAARYRPRMGLEGFLHSNGIIPTPQSEGFIYIRMNGHRA
jgi:hypothetical protein